MSNSILRSISCFILLNLLLSLGMFAPQATVWAADPPDLSIDDVTLAEGSAGATIFLFTVSLSNPAPPGGVTFDIATADNTAIAAEDYLASSLTGQTIPAGSSTYAFNVSISGDMSIETDETFFVNVTNITAAVAADTQGTGTILNDDWADLSISKQAGGSFISGGIGTYTITVLNNGPNQAEMVSMTDVLPAGLVFASLSAPGGWTCTTPAVGIGGTIIASTASLAAGESSVFTLTVEVLASGGSIVTNTAIVTGIGDPDESNNSATESTAVTALPYDLTINKTHVGELKAGETAVYTITVTNNGMGNTTGLVSVTDVLPLGLTAVAFSGTGWTTDLGTLIAVRSDSLAAGTSYPDLNLTVDVTADAPVSVQNIATVTIAGDAEPDNNTAIDTAAVEPISRGSGETPTAPVLDTGAALSIKATSAVLAGMITVRNGSIISYGFDYGTDINRLNESITVGSDNLTDEFTCPVTDLSPNTTYYYRAWSTNSSGLKGYGPVKSFVTGEDSILPTTPLTEPEPPAVYLDLRSDHWAYAAVGKLTERGCISGYPDGSFRPNAHITRAEFVTVLANTLGLKPRRIDIPYEDTDNHWAHDYIAAAHALGIVEGFAEFSFKPDDPITREQMAVIAVKAAGLTPATGQTTFSDNDEIALWSRSSVLAAANANLIKGYPDNTFRPQGLATRAEAVSIILSLLN